LPFTARRLPDSFGGGVLGVSWALLMLWPLGYSAVNWSFEYDFLCCRYEPIVTTSGRSVRQAALADYH
jgi:hypothetical protein